MGYITNISGTIKLSEKKYLLIIQELLKRGKNPFVEFQDCDINMERLELSLNDSWKNYDNDIEKICVFIAQLDNKAEGEISCEGEDAGDIWKIDIGQGKAKIMVADISYHEEHFDCTYKEEIDEILNDEQFMKGVLVEALN